MEGRRQGRTSGSVVRVTVWKAAFVVYLVIYLVTTAQATNPAPTLTSISPSSGPVAGGTTVNLTGTNFVSGATVKFGSTLASRVTFVSSTSLTAVTPPSGSAGIVSVTETNPDGQSASLGGSTTQLLPNPGFELGTVDWKSNGSGTASIRNNSANAQSGSFYAELGAPLGSHPVLFATNTSGTIYFPVTPGDVIKFSGWAYRVSGDGLGRWTLAAADSNKSNPSYLSASPSNVTVASWTQQQATYTVPAGKSYIYVYCELFNNTATADVRFDSASLLQTKAGGGGFTYIALKSIAVTPANTSVPINSTVKFSATGTYTDNSTQVLTTLATWDSSNTSVATINKFYAVYPS